MVREKDPRELSDFEMLLSSKQQAAKLVASAITRLIKERAIQKDVVFLGVRKLLQETSRCAWQTYRRRCSCYVATEKSGGTIAVTVRWRWWAKREVLTHILILK